MSTSSQIHELQNQILESLLHASDLGFAQLQKVSGVEGNQFSFHIKKLVSDGLVEKIESGSYRLTTGGKEFANRLDTETRAVEKQPKSSVLLVIERKGADGAAEYLHQQRMKHPWYEYIVYVTGKIRFGESVYEAAGRELFEETGLKGSFEIKAISHERDFVKDSSKVLEDKLFYVMHCIDVRGDLTQPKEAKNIWMTRDEFLKSKIIDGGPRFHDYVKSPSIIFEENNYYFSESDF